MQDMQLQHAQADSVLQSNIDTAAESNEATAKQDKTTAAPAPITRAGKKVGRNDPCICGSGKKYKHCCGKLS